jgi:hypothetical protein
MEVVAPQGFEPRLIGSEPNIEAIPCSTVNYREVPKLQVFIGRFDYFPAFNYRAVLSPVLGISRGHTLSDLAQENLTDR